MRRGSRPSLELSSRAIGLDRSAGGCHTPWAERGTTSRSAFPAARCSARAIGSRTAFSRLLNVCDRIEAQAAAATDRILTTAEWSSPSKGVRSPETRAEASTIRDVVALVLRGGLGPL